MGPGKKVTDDALKRSGQNIKNNASRMQEIGSDIDNIYKKPAPAAPVKKGK